MAREEDTRAVLLAVASEEHTLVELLLGRHLISVHREILVGEVIVGLFTVLREEGGERARISTFQDLLTKPLLPKKR